MAILDDEDGLAFTVFDVKTGKKWKIWRTGQIEGFGEDAEGAHIVISNRFPRLVAHETSKIIKERDSENADL